MKFMGRINLDQLRYVPSTLISLPNYPDPDLQQQIKVQPTSSPRESPSARTKMNQESRQLFSQKCQKVVSQRSQQTARKPYKLEQEQSPQRAKQAKTVPKQKQIYENRPIYNEHLMHTQQKRYQGQYSPAVRTPRARPPFEDSQYERRPAPREKSNRQPFQTKKQQERRNYKYIQPQNRNSYQIFSTQAESQVFSQRNSVQVKPLRLKYEYPESPKTQSKLLPRSSQGGYDRFKYLKDGQEKCYNSSTKFRDIDSDQKLVIQSTQRKKQQIKQGIRNIQQRNRPSEVQSAGSAGSAGPANKYQSRVYTNQFTFLQEQRKTLQSLKEKLKSVKYRNTAIKEAASRPYNYPLKSKVSQYNSYRDFELNKIRTQLRAAIDRQIKVQCRSPIRDHRR